jgi:gliding motility-associated-like protein
MVFSKEGYQNLWDGTFNGVNLPAASYLYVIDVDNNGTIDFKGWVYITR